MSQPTRPTDATQTLLPMSPQPTQPKGVQNPQQQQPATQPATPTTPVRRKSRFSLFPSRQQKSSPSPSDLVLEATSRTPDPPSEKVVRAILAQLRLGGNTADRSTPVGAVIHRLRQRLANPNWQIALKALTLTHAILRNGPSAFVDFLASNPKDSFDTPNIRDFGQPNLHRCPEFTHSYARYIKAWCNMRRLTAFPPSGPVDPNAQPHLAQADAETIIHALPPICGVLKRLSTIARTSHMQSSPLFHPPVLMMIHDYLVLHEGISHTINRLINIFFHQNQATANRLLDTFDVCTKSLNDVRPILSTMVAFQPSINLPAMPLNFAIRDEMQHYVNSGCPGTTRNVGVTPWIAAATAATEPTLEPALQRDVDTVLRTTRGGDPRDPTSPFGAIINVLFARVREGHFKSVLKAQTLFLILMVQEGTCSDVLVDYLSTDGRQREGWLGPTIEAGEEIERDVHEPLARWLGSYTRVRMSMIRQLRPVSGIQADSARATAERLILSLPAVLDAVDVLQELPVDLSIRASPVTRRAYLTAVDDISRVFKEAVRCANALVGVFFELHGEVARAGLSVYERYVHVRDIAHGRDGIFERARIIDGLWRQPEEVAGETAILTDMRMFVEMLGRRENGTLGEESGGDGGEGGGREEDGVSDRVERMDDDGDGGSGGDVGRDV